jgi:hypothetical protein
MATGRVPTTANSPLTAKGDLFGYSTTQARVAVGNDGETLVADSSTSTGLRYQGSYAAGKNAIINGAMDIWQRGTSFSAAGYNADRWLYTGTFPTGTISRIVANGVSGVSSNTKYALRYNTTVAGGGYFGTRIEGAGWGNGQTVTLSFLARNNGASAKSISWESEQFFGTGGSPSSTVTSFFPSVSIPTGSNFVRYSVTVALPSTAGKTFGTNNDDFLSLRFYDLGVANIDLTELQLEIGSVATSFTRVGGTIQGELAACQRYFTKSYNTDVAPATVTSAGALTTYIEGTGVSNVSMQAQFKSSMRIAPTVTTYSGQGTTSQFSTDVTGSNSFGSTVVANIGTYGFYVSNTATATKFMLVHYAASAEL